MLNFTNLKSLHYKLEQTTYEYLERYFQGVFDAFFKKVNNNSEKTYFYYLEEFDFHNGSILKDIIKEIDPNELLGDLTFNITFVSDGTLILDNIEASEDEPEILPGVINFLEINGFSVEETEDNIRFVKII